MELRLFQGTHSKCHDLCDLATYLTNTTGLVSCHWRHNSALHDCGPRNQTKVNVCEVLEVDISSFASKAPYRRWSLSGLPVGYPAR